MSISRIGDRLGANEGLPLGYRRCEYLESTGTQYIDTGLPINNGSALTVTCEINPNSGVVSGALFGAQNGGVYQDRAGWSEYTAGTQGWLFWGWLSSSQSLPSAPSVRHQVALSQAGLFYNGAKLRDVDQGVFSTSGSCWLFARNRSDITVEKYHGKIYSFTFAQDGSPRLNLVPALDPNNRPCMFDTVTSTPLYNQGTGEFLYKVISPETAYIPANFTRVGYLESNGTQHIDTGINLSSESEVRCEYMATNGEFARGQALYGSFVVPRFSSYGLYGQGNEYKYYAYIGQDGSSKNFPVSVGQKNTLIHNSKSITFNEQTANFTDTTIFEQVIPCSLFGASSMSGCFRVYSFSISRNGQLQCNLIPCLDGDDVPCMYDTVSQTALYKVGGDQFLYGEDEEASKKLPAGYTKMNYLESTGTQWIDTDITLEKFGKAVHDIQFTGGSNKYMGFRAKSFSFATGLAFGVTKEGKIWYCGVNTYEYPFLFNRELWTLSVNEGVSQLSIGDNFQQRKTLSDTNEVTTYSVFSGLSQVESVLAKIYTVKIYDRNDVLQLELQPCLDPYGVPCMYDFVSKRPLYKEDNGDDGDQFLYG